MAVLNPDDAASLDAPGALPVPPLPPRPLIPYVPIRTALRVLLPSLLLGWTADALFYKRALGISVPLFTALALLTLFWVARQERVAAIRRNLWPIAPALFFAAMVAVHANPLLTALNLFALGTLLLLVAYFFSQGKLHALGVLGYPAALATSLGNSLVRPAPAVAVSSRLALGQRGHLRRTFPILRGVLIAFPLLALFTALLSSADSIFASKVGDVFELDLLTNLPERMWRLTQISAVAWLVSGGLLVAIRRASPVSESGAVPDTDTAPLVTRLRLGFGEAATLLFLVDALFAAFVWVQFAYLFSGHAAQTMHFEEYRTYARRGFGERLAVSVMTLLLIVSTRSLAWRPEWSSRVNRAARRHKLAINALATVMIGLTVVMLVSAFQRMLQWEQVDFYINTGTRLYVRWFIVWLGVAFAWLAGTLWLRPERFAIGGFVSLLCFLVTMNLQDPDADVARYNLARKDDLSTRYLFLLSDDAVPVLAEALASPEQSAALPPSVRRDLVNNLAVRLTYNTDAPGWSSWPSFHLALWRAHIALT